jgi:hypothetical protein
MKTSLSWQRFAICLSAAAVLVLGASLAPGAQASGSFKSCGNKQIKIKVGAENEKKTTTSITVKDVSAKGTSCASAFEFLRLTFSGEKISSTGFPQNYKCKADTFSVPSGYFPQTCTKPGKTIKYASPGG